LAYDEGQISPWEPRMTPEQTARKQIDSQHGRRSWAVQTKDKANRSAARGVVEGLEPEVSADLQCAAAHFAESVFRPHDMKRRKEYPWR
jgi:hypothetical protein